MSETTSIPSENWGVHIRHCCLKHGCKYSDPECPVELGLAKQDYGCEVGHVLDEDCFDHDPKFEHIDNKIVLEAYSDGTVIEQYNDQERNYWSQKQGYCAK